jgi:hypothetical protein
LIQTQRKKKPLNWSQLPWYKIEEAFKVPVEGNPVRKKKRKKIPFSLSLSDANHLGMGGNLVPLQQMLIWGTISPLSPTGMQPETVEDVDPEEKERSQRTARFEENKEILWQQLNSEQVQAR